MILRPDCRNFRHAKGCRLSSVLYLPGYHRWMEYSVYGVPPTLNQIHTSAIFALGRYPLVTWFPKVRHPQRPLAQFYLMCKANSWTSNIHSIQRTPIAVQARQKQTKTTEFENGARISKICQTLQVSKRLGTGHRAFAYAETNLSVREPFRPSTTIVPLRGREESTNY